MLNINDIRTYCTEYSIVLTDHLLTRMRQRNIRINDVMKTITSGEIIEQYPVDYPFPSCLVNYNGLHVVCSLGNEHLYIITAYKPSPEKWENEGKQRKEKKL